MRVCGHLGGLYRPIEFRQLHQGVCRRVPVQDAVDERRNGGEDQVEEDEHPGVAHDAPGETTEELIPEQQIHVHLQTQTQRHTVIGCICLLLI